MQIIFLFPRIRNEPTFGIAKTSRPNLFRLSLLKLPNRTDLQNQSSHLNFVAKITNMKLVIKQIGTLLFIRAKSFYHFAPMSRKKQNNFFYHKFRICNFCHKIKMSFDFECRFGSAVSAMKCQKGKVS